MPDWRDREKSEARTAVTKAADTSLLCKLDSEIQSWHIVTTQSSVELLTVFFRNHFISTCYLASYIFI